MGTFKTIVFLLSLFFLVRNLIVYRNYIKIIDAIFKYRVESFTNNSVSYYHMENYLKTFLRFWDFGYKHILPEEKYKIIEPYLK